MKKETDNTDILQVHPECLTPWTKKITIADIGWAILIAQKYKQDPFSVSEADRVKAIRLNRALTYEFMRQWHELQDYTWP